MKLRDVENLERWDKLRVLHGGPFGESVWNKETKQYDREFIPKGTVVYFDMVIPKVRVVGPPPANDKYDVFLLCRSTLGEHPDNHVWLNICNAEAVKGKEK